MTVGVSRLRPTDVLGAQGAASCSEVPDTCARGSVWKRVRTGFFSSGCQRWPKPGMHNQQEQGSLCGCSLLRFLAAACWLAAGAHLQDLAHKGEAVGVHAAGGQAQDGIARLQSIM